MSKAIEATYEIAMAASRDEGNRNARRNGRSRWNEDDWNAAVAQFERLYPVPGTEDDR